MIIIKTEYYIQDRYLESVTENGVLKYTNNQNLAMGFNTHDDASDMLELIMKTCEGEAIEAFTTERSK